MDGVTAGPRHDNRNHPIAKTDIGLARARRDHLVHLEGPAGQPLMSTRSVASVTRPSSSPPNKLRHWWLLRCDTIEQRECTIRLAGRPHPVPLDPASWAILTRCLAHRQSQHTRNPHVIVTKVTKTGREPASAAYLTHVLDDCGLAPRTVRSTRLVDLVNTMDPKLVAVAFGIDPEAAMIYLADHVDPTRLPTNDTVG